MAENISGKLPYTSTIVASGELWVCERRVFKDFNERELFWHRDKEDREIRLVEGSIELQLENRMPIKLKPYQGYLIPKMCYHRVIAVADFTIDVYKYIDIIQRGK